MTATKAKTDNGAAPVDDLPPPPLCDPAWYYRWACGTSIPVPEWEEADQSGFDATTGKIHVASGGVTRTVLRHQLAHYILWLAKNRRLSSSAEEHAIKATAGRTVAASDCDQCVSPHSGME